MMIKAEVMGSCCILRLARSEKANALTGAMLQDLRAAIVSAADSGAKALILTGEGRVFSAGADLDEMANGLGTILSGSRSVAAGDDKLFLDAATTSFDGKAYGTTIDTFDETITSESTGSTRSCCILGRSITQTSS